MIPSQKPTINTLLPSAETPAEEPQPEESIEDFFTTTNAALASLTAKILAHANALSGPGEPADTEALKTSASVVRTLETSIRALKRVQDIRIAQEKILAPKREAQAKKQQDYTALSEHYIASIKRAREYRRIAASPQGTLTPLKTADASRADSAPQAPAPEPEATETPGETQVLPAAMVHGSSIALGGSPCGQPLSTAPGQWTNSAESEPASTVTDHWTPGSTTSASEHQNPAARNFSIVFSQRQSYPHLCLWSLPQPPSTGG